MKSLKIGEIVQLQRGTTYKGSLLGENGPVLLGLATIKPHGGFRYDNFKRYSGESPAKLLLKSGDLFVSLKDVTQNTSLLGAVARVPDKIDQGRVTQDTVKLEFISTEIPPIYLYWQLRTPQYRSYCRGRATGTTTLGLSREDFLSYEIPFPNSELELIVETLDEIENKIELNNHTNETLETIAKAIFKEWFIDFGPVKAKAEGRKPFGMDDETAALFPDSFEASELGLIPKGWTISTLGDSCNVVMGQSPPGESYNEAKSGKLFYQGRAEFGDRFPEPRLYTTQPTRHADRGSVLLSVRAPVGDLNIALDDVCIGRGLASVLHKIGKTSFTYYLLDSLSDQFVKYNGEGTVFGSINKDTLSNIKIINPNEEIIKKFLSIAEPLDEVYLQNHLENIILTTLRDTLLPKLISGEIELKD